MSVPRARIQRNLESVRNRIEAAAERAGRSPGSVRLVAVTKAVGLEEARALHELGVRELGENRVDDAREKVQALETSIRWHMIGTCQRRKARDIVALFDSVDSVDRLELAEALQRHCDEQNRALSVLIEVNVSGESAKHGFDPSEVAATLDQMRHLDRLKVGGLMTMAPLTDDAETVRPVFADLRELARALGLPELSMGMTNDFEVAIEEGATQVRIGTALFA